MSERWPKVGLGEVLDPVQRPEVPIPGTMYRQLGVRLWGEGAYEREPVDGAATKYATLSRVGTDDVVVNKIWARNGSVAVVQPELDGCFVSSEFPTYQPQVNKVLPRWMHWLTKSADFWAQCDERSRGTSGKNRIKPEEFLRIEIPLPAIEEQERIVARIEELAAKVEEARGLRRGAVEERTALFASALSAEMDPLHPAWTQSKLGDVIVSMDAGWSPQCEDQPARSRAWGVLKTTSVQWCEFQPHQNKALPLSLEPRSSLAVSKGDVLITRAGPRKRVGVVAAVRKSEPLLTISDKLIRVRPNQELIHYRFLELALAAPFSQEYLVQRKTGLADAQVNISQSILRAMPVAFPPLEEQLQIVERLQSAQERSRAVASFQDQSAAELDALLPSILDTAFRGEL